MGLETDLANNGQEAFEKRKNGTYDIVFMDIQMPVMDGVEATHAILDYEGKNDQPHVPIVALTANALKGDRERFLNEGLDEYVSKPIEMNELLYVLNKFLADKARIGKTQAENTEEKTSEKKPASPRTDARSPQLEPAVSAPSQHTAMPAAPKTTTEQSDSPDKAPRTILIAKQSALSGKIIARLLEAQGYQTILVHDPLAFEEHLRQKQYKAVFVDEDFVRADTRDLLLKNAIPIILTSDPKHSELFDGLNYHKVDSVLSQNALASLLNTLE